MRTSFVRTLIEIAEDDPRVVLLTGDLGFSVIEPFAERFPNRFFNVGVAEQNMVGVATGLAEAGFVPFTYSIVTFASLRPYEFIRNGPVLHSLPVRIVAVGGGFEYGDAGPTHHGIEDVGIMRIQSGLTVLCPADHQQTATILRSTWDLPGPIYYRLGKDDKTVVPGLDGRFHLGHAQQIRFGSDLLILVMGSAAKEAITAADDLAARGTESTVMVVASVNPPPVNDLVEALQQFPIVLTVEAHFVVGGLGSLVSEIVAEHRIGCRVYRCGVRAAHELPGGSETYLFEQHGLSSEALVKTAERAAIEVEG